MKEKWSPFFEFCKKKMQDILPKNDYRLFKDKYEKAIKLNDLLNANGPKIELVRTAKSIMLQKFQKQFEKKGADTNIINMVQRIKEDSNEFRSLMEENILKGRLDDLQVNDKIAKLINRYSKRDYQSYLFWVFTEQEISNKDTMNPLREVLYYGQSEGIKRLSMEFLRYFNLTYTRIKETVANNLMEELSKEQTESQAIIHKLKVRQQELEQALEEERKKQLEKGIRKFIEKLQSIEQPLLNQFYNVYQMLLNKEQQEQQLTSIELNLLIAFENFFKVLNTFEIEPYPKNKKFDLDWHSLKYFQYQSGSNFLDENDLKLVICKEIGWKHKEEIISRAIVEEYVEDREK
jgi:hypothetical protein